MKLLFHGFLSPGSTALHRMESFAAIPEVQVEAVEALPPGTPKRSLVGRVLWRLRLPQDIANENGRLLSAAERFRPDVVFVDNSRVIKKSTLVKLRKLGARSIVYYSPDDIIARHNLSFTLASTFREWDLFFTTKTFNVAELSARGVKRPRLIANGYSLRDHRPMSAGEVGPEFERHDLVFIGTCERSRGNSLIALARAGFSVVVYGNDAGASARWSSFRHPNISLRTAVYAEEYSRCSHHGKIALCFLRKANRDEITQRSIEIPAMQRPMLAEKTHEHDLFFQDGSEYFGFRNDDELIAQARLLLENDALRESLALQGRARCLTSDYSNEARAAEMLKEIAALREVSA